MADFRLTDHGSITLLTPLNMAARKWMVTHLPDDAQQFGMSTVIEHRYVADIAHGLIDDGLTLEVA